jgi:hypothetical protein
MPNSEECRQRATRCLDLADAARTPQLRESLLDAALMWSKLAVELEKRAIGASAGQHREEADTVRWR